METLMQKSHTREELLINTINHFNSNNRCSIISYDRYIGESCKYRMDDKACAIGRELTDEQAAYLDNMNSNGVNEPKVFEVLPDRLKAMGEDYLIDIQNMHDDKAYWDENGLNEHGGKLVTHICKKYGMMNPLVVEI
jgi:tRNA A-37 threonylcarbamoyl transferase component Bud32